MKLFFIYLKSIGRGDLMRIMIILPCNSKVKVGNYGQGYYWRRAFNILRPSSNIIYSAVDCIPSRFKTDLDYCIIIKGEEKALKGFDARPEKKADPELINCVEKGLRRALKIVKPDLIIIILNVNAYIEAVLIALKRICRINEKVIIQKLWGWRTFVKVVARGKIRNTEILLVGMNGLPGIYLKILTSVLSLIREKYNAVSTNELADELYRLIEKEFVEGIK